MVVYTQLSKNARHYFVEPRNILELKTNITSTHRINIEQMTKSLMKDKDVLSICKSIVESCSKTEVYKEIKFVA